MAKTKNLAIKLPQGAPKFAALAPLLSDEAFEQRVHREVPGIVAAFKFDGLEDQLKFALGVAHERYHTWHGLYDQMLLGLGEKSGLDPLIGALKKSLRELTKIQMRNRLEVAAENMPQKGKPAGPADGVYFLYGSSVFDTLPRAQANLKGLLAVTECARNLDGRSLNKLEGSLRAAADPLYAFWVHVAGGPKRIGQRGGTYSPAVRFLRAALAIIESSVTERLICDFKFPKQHTSIPPV